MSHGERFFGGGAPLSLRADNCLANCLSWAWPYVEGQQVSVFGQIVGVTPGAGTMRTWTLCWFTRIRATSQFPQVYSTVGSGASSTGGASAIAAVASGWETILSAF